MLNTNIKIPKMRTIKQTAAELGLPEYFVRSLVKQKQVTYVKACRMVLINLDQFIKFLGGAVSNDEKEKKDD